MKHLKPQEIDAEISTTRSVERAATLLRLLVLCYGGIRLTDLAERAGLHKATALRILGALEREGLVDRDPETKLYSLGMEILAAGWASVENSLLRECGVVALRRIAEKTEDTAYLSVRSGLESLCVGRQEGSFPIKTLTLESGSRRPLGVGAGSLALLAFLPDEEIRKVIHDIEPLLAPYKGYSAQALLTLVEESRRTGYAFNPGLLVQGMQAVAVPVLSANGTPVAALSVAAITERMTADRLATIVVLLREEADKIELMLKQRNVKSAKKGKKQS